VQEVSETDILTDLLNKHMANYTSYAITFEEKKTSL